MTTVYDKSPDMSFAPANREEAGMYGIAFNNAGTLLAVSAKNHIQLFSRQLEFKFELKDLGHESVRAAIVGCGPCRPFLR